MYTLLDVFSGDYISALRGCCAMKFLYALEIDQGYLTHTPTGTGVPPKKSESWKLNIWPKIQRVRLNNFRVSGSILTGVFLSTSREAGARQGDKVSTIFTMPALKKLWRPKNRPKIFAIFDNFPLSSRISPERIYISNIWKKLDQPLPFPRWTKETWWTLVHKQKSSRGAYWATQVDIFRETTFRPLGSAAPSKFYRR